MRGGAPVYGTGFVVVLDSDQATVVTAAHVIEGVQQIVVTFAADPTRGLLDPKPLVYGMDTDNANGLAAFLVHGRHPAGVTTLSLDTKNRPKLGSALFLLGFWPTQIKPYTPQRSLAGRDGIRLLIDQHIGEGFSGGPVVQDGKVVGVITTADDEMTYAVVASVAYDSLDGWGVKLGEQSTPSKPAAEDVGSCVSGEERPENGIVFVRICPGTFTMGSSDDDLQAEDDEKPAHKVTLSEFWIGKTEITNEQFRRLYPEHQGQSDLPATGVSWDDAKAACEHFGGRLPTEAEWEYAARAGSRTAWSFGSDEKKLDRYAWFSEYPEPNAVKPRKPEVPRPSGKLHPVGMKMANAWGLQDMHGNALEWVADAYRLYPRVAQTNPQNPGDNEFHVLRGGSCYSTPRELRSARRRYDRPSSLYSYFGFRCVLSPGQP